MTGFSNIRQVVDARINGQQRFTTFRKIPNQITTIGVWFDLSMSPGNPSPKYWFDATPMKAAQISLSADGGVFHGGNVSPSYKYLAEATIMCQTAVALPMPMIVCDYLMYYPSIGEDTTDEQLLDNSAASLPRYTDGAGVQVIAISVASRTGGQSFYITYTNQNGVAGRTSKTVRENTVSVTGSIVTSQQTGTAVETAGVFIPLQDGDTGVRSIESVTMLGTDVGLFSLVLVKPLAQLSITGIDAPVEVNYMLNCGLQLPRVYDNAFLGFLCMPQGSLSGAAINGNATFIWG